MHTNGSVSSSSNRLPTHNPQASKYSKSISSLSFHHGLLCMIFMLASFYVGLLVGQQSMDSKCQECLRDYSSIQRFMETTRATMVKALQTDQDTTDTKLEEILLNAFHKVNEKELIQSTDHHEHAFLQTLKDDLAHAKEKPLIPSPLQRLFSGMARVSRDDFFQQYDTSVPQDETIAGNENVLLLYSNRNALPPNHDGTGIPLLSIESATQHCNTLKIVMTQPDSRNECLALVGQWESYHVQKFMRLPNDNVKGSVSESNPLRHVSRLHIDSGLAQRIPTSPKVHDYNRQLVTYLSTFDAVLKELKPIAAKAAKDNTIVVMVCNHGQSELLMNFVCSSRARGLDLSQVLVFATDEETRDLAEGLGLVAFYSHVHYTLR
jgi:hypothetical protein